ncbi:uncharacterized protein HMPREF1541_06330 [Cyphellophora europaea CBS 101466]|uniref:beta-galactosidase n=1 Tax=Cyphellophora europaea (strain CBS 101466) TaxID=1220924 RepID=W2RRE1_CYPE1|nr:uncharacterized protein HMPREF1541_06330 [Cyphellophora europaea CBS 101466]ETN38299.1 hypothetical protein HMPREF1541_06330 [Cyphellophora europaea CBS 101466]
MAASVGMSLPGVVPDWTNLSVLHRNTLPPRAHFYNFASETAALSFDKYQSEYYSLNGTWKFRYDSSPFEAPAWESVDPSEWDDIEVPGMWQTQGYGHPHYTNIEYPFPVTPPNVSYINPTGSYWREFEVPERSPDQQLRLRFEGVDSAFHIWVNGEEVGYSQGSRNPSEFDITNYISNGTNTLATRVYQWSDGSYIEDQDQWWLSGIFRDVYLIPFPQLAVVDFELVPHVADDYSSGILSANFTLQGETSTPLNVTLFSPNGDVLQQWSGGPSEACEFEVTGSEFHLWSPENPTLYSVVIAHGEQYLSQKIGFRRVELTGSNFLVNGEPVIIYGVNRHEHSALSGRTVRYEDMRADLITMKRSNINAIRTAHQPHHPDFFDVADELGFYVISEADLECHGFGTITYTGEQAASWLSDNPDWENAYLDRAEQLVERFKNHPSIIFWSLGNECFYGRNHMAMYNFIKQRDPTRLVHYEPDKNATSADMYSAMYLSLDSINQHIGNFTDKPLLLCEFAHAMGNGPGGLPDYIARFRAEPLLQGGLVWEWSNHGLLHEENGTEYYAYGGDFGDEPNDADFIMDGLMLSDHSPMPSIFEYAKAIQPVEVKWDNDTGEVNIHNWYAFIDLSGLNVFWHIVTDGNVTDPTTWDIPNLLAGENITVPLPFDRSQQSSEAWFTVEFQLASNETWAAAGHVVAWEQLHLPYSSTLPGHRYTRSPALPRRQATPNVTITPTSLQLSSDSNALKFDLLLGNVTWNTSTGLSLLHRGPELYLYRAMTQNDLGGGGDAQYWEEARLDTTHTQIRDVFYDISDNGDTTVTYYVRVGPKVLEWAAEAILTYTIPTSSSSSSSSGLQIRAQGAFVGNNTPEVLPRIGLLTYLPETFEEVTWFGRGPGESYRDSKLAQRFGTHESTVDGLFTHYDFPQENGNREDVHWLRLSDGDVTLEARMTDADGAPDPFSFTAKHFTDQDLDRAGHPYELERFNATVLNLDYDTNGLGSATVGPRPFEWYRCYSGPFDFTFELTLI